MNTSGIDTCHYDYQYFILYTFSRTSYGKPQTNHRCIDITISKLYFFKNDQLRLETVFNELLSVTYHTILNLFFKFNRIEIYFPNTHCQLILLILVSSKWICFNTSCLYIGIFNGPIPCTYQYYLYHTVLESVCLQ